MGRIIRFRVAYRPRLAPPIPVALGSVSNPWETARKIPAATVVPAGTMGSATDHH